MDFSRDTTDCSASDIFDFNIDDRPIASIDLWLIYFVYKDISLRSSRVFSMAAGVSIDDTCTF